MTILFLATRPDKPSYRFRVAPFVAALREEGWDVEVAFLPRGAFARHRLLAGLGVPDLVVVQKRLFGRLDLGQIRRRARRLVYDLDDAVMFRSEDGRREKRRDRRFRAIVRAADLVLAGNDFLAEEVRRAGGRVEVLPTGVDTNRYRPPRTTDSKKEVTIGWSGSSSTNRYFVELIRDLPPLRPTTPFRFLVVSNEPPRIDKRPALPRIDFEPWTEETELSLLQSFDIGIMPLTDSPWSRGKCGLKLLLSQAVGTPVVTSAVGVNPSVIVPEKTGFLARTPAEWNHRLTQLIEDPPLRRRMGHHGRAHVEREYSVQALHPRLRQILESLS